METKYIYLFKRRDGYYKIGISNNVDSRLASIRTSNYDHVEIVIARKIKDAFNFEQELHKKYDQRITRSNGEWFKLNSDEVIDICVQINLAEGEKPRIESQSLEKALQKYSENHEAIRESLVFLKKLLNRTESKPINIPAQIFPIPEAMTKIGEAKRGDISLIKEAEDVVRKEGRASSSLLQRKLSIGYSRAARIIDKLQEKGIVGPQNGAMSREVIPI